MRFSKRPRTLRARNDFGALFGHIFRVSKSISKNKIFGPAILFAIGLHSYYVDQECQCNYFVLMKLELLSATALKNVAGRLHPLLSPVLTWEMFFY